MTGPASEGGPIIQSRHNPVVKRVRSLQRPKGRLQERAFVVEGRRSVHDALDAGARLELVLVEVGADALVGDVGVGDRSVVRRVSSQVMELLSETATPPGILAVVGMPTLDISPEMNPLVLVVDGVRDPGNMGTLIRAAAGAGAQVVVVADGSVDAFHPRAVRAGMGAHFRVPLRVGTEAAVAALQRCDVRALADASGGTPHDAVDWSGAVAVIIGGEAHGAGDLLSRWATTRVGIPLSPGVESLNAGVAGAVLLFEAARQRAIIRRHAG